jgi:hypothetical protein
MLSPLPYYHPTVFDYQSTILHNRYYHKNSYLTIAYWLGGRRTGDVADIVKCFSFLAPEH